jgi:uncharacterized membrane protein
MVESGYIHAFPFPLAHVLLCTHWNHANAYGDPSTRKEVHVPTSAMLFAMLADVSVAPWTICLKLGSTKINAALGALVISVVALIVNADAVLTLKAQGHGIVLTQDALWLLVMAGIAAAGVDMFALLAYTYCLPSNDSASVLLYQ